MNDPRPSPQPAAPASPTTPVETVLRPPATDRDSIPAESNTVTHERRDPATASFAGVTPRSTELPANIGRYSIRRLLGHGGMGEVYLAHDPELDRPVALKVPRLAGPAAEERFLREARASAALKHENVCPVHDVGRADGVLYLVMAYIPGPTLTDVLRQEGSLPTARACAVAVAIARGVAEAHRHGIVHRDLKPGNVLMDTRRGGEGEPVVTDFGLALRAGNSTATDPDTAVTIAPGADPRLTQAGALIGTPAYMPPEQARGDLDQVGPTADVYALGAILFELLTGTPPFRGDKVADVIRQIENAPAPAPSEVRPELPAGLDEVVLKALAKEPAERFQSMDAFADALASFATPPRRRRAGAVALAAAAAILLLVGGVIFYVQTDNGVVEVRLNDPAADVKVSVDGNEIKVADGTRVTKLRAGPHALEVKGPDFETETRVFKVTRGDKTVVEIELKPKEKLAGKPSITPPLEVAVAPMPRQAEAKPAVDPQRRRLAELLASGRLLIRDYRARDLGPIVEEAFKIDPESPGAFALRASLRDTRNDPIGARADVEESLKLNPETYQALLMRSLLSGKNRKFDDTIADATVAIRVEPNNPTAWANRAQAYFEKKEYHQAARDAARAIELADKFVDPLLTRGGAYVHLGEYEKALADYAKAAELLPARLQIFGERSAIYAKMGNKEKADADWKTAQSLSKEPLPVQLRPTIPDPPKPIERKKLTAQEKTDFDAAMEEFWKGWEKGDPACLEAAEEACRIDPTSAAAHSAHARILTMAKKFKEALTEANEAIRLDANDAWAYSARGAAKTDAKDVAGSIADQTIALRLDSSIAQAWDARGYAYLQRQQYHQAVADLSEAIRLWPSANRYVNRGKCYLHLGEYAKALADYEHAANLQPLEARSWMMCATIKAKLGDPTAAKDRERALAIEKNLPAMPLPPPLVVKRDPELEPGTVVTIPPLPKPDPRRVKLAELLARGKVLVDQGRADQLAKVAEEALAIDPESPTALAFRATVYRSKGNFVDAKADARAALKLNPETAQAMLVLSTVYGDEDKTDEAIMVETMAQRIDPKNPWGWVNRSKSFLDRKHLQLAINDATKAIDMGFPLIEPRLNRAAACALLGNYEKALADYDAAAGVEENDSRIYDQRAMVYARMGNKAKAAADWKRAEDINPELKKMPRGTLPSLVKSPELKKLTAQEKADFDKAMEAAERAWLTNNGPECVKHVEEACRIDPTSALAHARRARVYVQLDRYKDAITEADAAIKLDPANADAFAARGVAQIGLRKMPAAIADLTVAVELDPKHQRARSNRSFAYTMQGYPHQGLADANEALRLNPTDPQAFVNRGGALYALGDFKASLAAYEEAYKACGPSPEAARVRRTMAAIKFRMNDVDGAKADLELATKLDGVKDAPPVPLPQVLPPAKKDPEPETPSP